MKRRLCPNPPGATLESFDAEVFDYITNLIKSGAVVNRRIVIAAVITPLGNFFLYKVKTIL